MASEAETPEFSSLVERLFRHGDMSLFLPFILGFTNMTRRDNSENPEDSDRETTGTPENSGGGDRIILINPFTQGMVVIEGASNMDSLLSNLATKDGQPPASKASVEAMPCFKICESEVGGEVGGFGECAICLEEYEAGDVAREMPCKHRFHDKCIEKWLGIHGSCPICRFKMPVDEQEINNKGDREQRREIWVSFSMNSGRTNGRDSTPTETETVSLADSTDDLPSSPSSRSHQEMED